MTPQDRLATLFGHLGTVCQIVGATLILIVLGHYVIGGAVFVRNLLTTGEIEKIDVRFAAPVYDNSPEMVEYWKEFGRVWAYHFEPYYHWRRGGFAGKHINISPDGIRLTTGANPSPDAKKVFMLGGSTVWGTGAPDGTTIPSILQSLLGDGYEVINYGETGYVSAQELNYLLFQLARGNIPDVVIFYDGVNDGYAGAYSPAIPRDPHGLRLDSKTSDDVALLMYENSNYKDLMDFLIEPMLNKIKYSGGQHLQWDAAVAPEIDANSQGVVDMYDAHIRQVEALADEYGFKAFFFWQPSLFSLGRNHMTSFESNEIETASPTLVSSQQRVYQIAKERYSNRQSEGIFFLGDIFDDVEEPIYIDWHHVGPNGNEIIAKQMLELLHGAL